MTTHIYINTKCDTREREKDLFVSSFSKYFVYNRISSVFVCLHFCCIYDILTRTTFQHKEKYQVYCVIIFLISLVAISCMYVCMYVFIYNYVTTSFFLNI